MWSHAQSTLRCPKCKGGLELHSLEAEVVPGIPELEWVEQGGLECGPCHVVYPVDSGVPVMLTYATGIAIRAAEQWPRSLRDELDSRNVRLPAGTPPPGERFVRASFSTEWEAYDYGSTLWTTPVEDRVRTFRGECGASEGELAGKRFVEIGCGLGITTNDAASTLGAEAWGVDLSFAVFRAARQFKDNPQLHFAQASVFQLPFERNQFDFLYSHGVLHHTWNTREAIDHAAALVRPGGGMYIWLYGHDDVHISTARRLAYALEQVTRPVIARMPSWLATVALLPAIPAYQLASFLGQRSGTHMHTYSAEEALHAARDRLTPLFAHRHRVPEVNGWLEELGFDRIHRVTASEVSEGWALPIERNVALRAWLPTLDRKAPMQ